MGNHVILDCIAEIHTVTLKKTSSGKRKISFSFVYNKLNDSLSREFPF